MTRRNIYYIPGGGAPSSAGGIGEGAISAGDGAAGGASVGGNGDGAGVTAGVDVTVDGSVDDGSGEGVGGATSGVGGAATSSSFFNLFNIHILLLKNSCERLCFTILFYFNKITHTNSTLITREIFQHFYPLKI